MCHAHCTRFVIANNFLSQDGATPLFKAAHKGHTAVIGELLKYRPSLGILPVRVREKSTSFKYSKNIPNKYSKYSKNIRV